MTIWPEFRMGKYRDEDHRGDALYINVKLFLALHHAETEAGRGHSKLISTRIALIVSTGFFSMVQSYFPPSNQNGLKENGEIIPDEELKILIQNEVALRESMVHRL